MQKNGMQGVFSIGRVQTPTLYLIYQRNKEIEQFISKPFYELYANFTHAKGTYRGKYTKHFDSELELDEFKKKNQLIDNSKGLIVEVKTEEKKTYAPKLFSLSDLQATANKKLGYDALETLKIVQDLYEKKLVSYPRTDSNYIGRPEFEYLKENLSNYLSLVGESIEKPQLHENKRYVDGSKVQEHYSIIPTKTVANLDKLAEKEKSMYKLILYRTLAIFEKPYVYDETNITTTINTVPFKTTRKVEKELGWKKLYIKEKKDSKEIEPTLPNVLMNDTVISNPETKKGLTQPPKYYTEGTLITAMKNVGGSSDTKENKDILKETEGIGTEATRANVIETLKKTRIYYCSKEKYPCYRKGKNTLRDY
ncbi:MAG: DNA topoisomerase [Staphylococcus equorum]|nr:DNA topoisomerase [Staphylococcus equorum]